MSRGCWGNVTDAPVETIWSETVGLSAPRYLDDWLESLDSTADTRSCYRNCLEDFTEWIDEARPDELIPSTIRDYRDSLSDSYSAATINLRLSALRSFFDWAVRNEIMDSNPAGPVQSLRNHSTSHRHKRQELSAEEVSALIETCSLSDDEPITYRDKTIICLMAYTGTRTVELHRADIGDLEHQNDRLTLWVQGKGQRDKSDFVVIPQPANDALSQWMAVHPNNENDDAPLFVSLSYRNKGDRLTRHAIRTMIKRRMNQAGIDDEDKSAHSLRHSAISQAIRAGADPQEAQAMARHSNINTTMTYYHEIDRITDPAEDRIHY